MYVIFIIERITWLLGNLHHRNSDNYEIYENPDEDTYQIFSKPSALHVRPENVNWVICELYTIYVTVSLANKYIQVTPTDSWCVLLVAEWMWRGNRVITLVYSSIYCIILVLMKSVIYMYVWTHYACVYVHAFVLCMHLCCVCIRMYAHVSLRVWAHSDIYIHVQ